MATEIAATVGGTPLLQLRRLFPGAVASVYAKLEGRNPMGSSKDRAAAAMLLDAVESGLVTSNRTTVIESTSGNMGIALAQICLSLGLPLICVVDERLTPRHRQLLLAFGARIEEVTVPDAVTGELLPARLQRVQDLLREIPDSFWPNQYANLSNAAGQSETCAEIVEQLGRAPDYLFCATGTCGTLRGCYDYIKHHRLPTRLIAVDAEGSRIFNDTPKRRLIPGLGSAIRPPLVQGVEIDRVIRISEMDAIDGARALLQREAVLAGGSSGAVVAAVSRSFDLVSQPLEIVAILPDSGERYIDTIFDDAWVASYFGGLPS